jgi:aspartate aminotransferase-like enzyme
MEILLPKIMPVAVYTNDQAQTKATSTDQSIVQFDTKVVDNYNAVTTGAAWKFTAPIPGLYLVHVALDILAASGWQANDLASLYLRKNTTEVASYLYASQTAHSNYVCPTLTYIVQLNAGDYIDSTWWQTSDSNKSFHADPTRNFISIAMVSV